MSRWLVMAMALGVVFLWAGSAFSAERVVITGVIADWQAVKTRVPETAYLQLVKYGKDMKGSEDEQGFFALDSKLPKVQVRANGSFKITVKSLSDGDYIFALQRAVPKEMSGGSIGTAVPILVNDKGQPLGIQVPGNYPMNVGKVFVAVYTKKEVLPAEKAKKESQVSEKTEKKPKASEKK